MPAHYIILIAVVAVALFIAIWGFKNLARAKKLAAENTAICREESRMLDFLHNLGESIEQETSATRLQQIIVNGVVNVIGASGGAIYFIDTNRQILIPKFVSDHCPQIIGVPLDIAKRAKKDPRILESHMRMAQQSTDEGILGACLISGKSIFIADLKSHEAMSDALVSFDGNIAVMAAPLFHAGKDLGVLIVAREHEQGTFGEHDFTVFRSIAEQSSFALGNSLIHLEASEKRSLENELRHAREVQRILLPQANPKINGYDIAGINIPARLISGDYYDFINLENDRLGIVIADVSGKGVPAGLLMVMCRSLLRAYSVGESSPTKVLASVNRQLFPDTKEDMFITLTYVILDGKNSSLTISRAGHDPALYYEKESGEITQIKSPGLAIGFDEGDLFERKTQDLQINLREGDCILLHTDGLREAINDEEDEYGIERLKNTFRQSAAKGASAILLDMQQSHRDFKGNASQKDDITLVVIEKI